MENDKVEYYVTRRERHIPTWMDLKVIITSASDQELVEYLYGTDDVNIKNLAKAEVKRRLRRIK